MDDDTYEDESEGISETIFGEPGGNQTEEDEVMQ